MPDNQKFGKRLVQAGVITQEQLEEALKNQGLEEGRLGELLVRLGYVSESTILQFLAAEFRTRYVSTERLARARIPADVLELLPVQLAERYNLIPVLFDMDTQTLSVVTSEPQNEDNLREVHMLTSVRELRVYVALQPAVQAAIRKHYRGEINAFKELLFQEGEGGALESSGYPSSGPLHQDAYGNPLYGQQGMSEDYLPANQPQMYGATPSPYGSAPGYNIANPYGGEGYDYNYNANANANPGYDANQQGYNNPANYPTSYDNAYQEGYEDDVTRLHANPYMGNAEGYDPNAVGYGYGQQDFGGQVMGQGYGAPLSPLARINVTELTRRLVQQAESLSPRYKRHQSTQQPVMEVMLRRLNYSPEESQPLWLALYLHHFYLPEPHPCLLNLEPDSEVTKAMEGQHNLHLATFNHMQLPDETLETLTYMYERVDGKGFPSQMSQDEIPLGARLLALLDAIEELQYQNPNMMFSKIVEKLNAHKGTLFDERLLGILEEEKERLSKYQQGTIPHILLLDPDVNLVGELEKLLWDRGFWIHTAYSLSQAELLCQQQSFDMVMLELDLGPEQDALAWIEQQQTSHPQPPEFIILTQRQDELDRGMALARDYLVKPMSANVIVAKLHKQLTQMEAEKKNLSKGTGLSGSLEQLGLPEILQVLSQSRRTGQLAITTDTIEGNVYLDDGEVVNAIAGDVKGEPAFGIMMSWTKGEFNFDPGTTTDERLINKRLDGLILDSFRVLDESRRDGVDDPFAVFGSSDSLPDLKESDDEAGDFFDLSLSDDDFDASDSVNKSEG